jgi:hypothetical protein
VGQKARFPVRAVFQEDVKVITNMQEPEKDFYPVF